MPVTDQDDLLLDAYLITELDMDAGTRCRNFGDFRRMLLTACSIIVAKLPLPRAFKGNLHDGDKRNNVGRMFGRNGNKSLFHRQ